MGDSLGGQAKRVAIIAIDQQMSTQQKSINSNYCSTICRKKRIELKPVERTKHAKLVHLLQEDDAIRVEQTAAGACSDEDSYYR
ncbi:MAG: hypothetical protein ACRCWT_08905, partial [Aeromonas veronii]